MDVEFRPPTPSNAAPSSSASLAALFAAEASRVFWGVGLGVFSGASPFHSTAPRSISASSFAAIRRSADCKCIRSSCMALRLVCISPRSAAAARNARSVRSASSRIFSSSCRVFIVSIFKDLHRSSSSTDSIEETRADSIACVARLIAASRSAASCRTTAPCAMTSFSRCSKRSFTVPSSDVSALHRPVIVSFSSASCCMSSFCRACARSSAARSAVISSTTFRSREISSREISSPDAMASDPSPSPHDPRDDVDARADPPSRLSPPFAPVRIPESALNSGDLNGFFAALLNGDVNAGSSSASPYADPRATVPIPPVPPIPAAARAARLVSSAFALAAARAFAVASVARAIISSAVSASSTRVTARTVLSSDPLADDPPDPPRVMLPSGVYSSGYAVTAGLCVRLYALDSSAYEENVFGFDGGGFDDEEMNESMDASLDANAFDARAPSPLSLLDGSFGGTAG